jgi:predicted ATPase
MNNNNWYVITGAPHSGKTTLIEMLRDLGYKVVLEAARVYIDEEMEEGKALEEIRKDELAFQRKVLELKIENEKKESPNEIIFWDRGIPDSLAYYEMLGFAKDKFLQEATEKAKYKKVFLLGTLSYEKDYARTESEDQQKLIHELLKKAYRQHGHKLVEIENVGPKERLRIILESL